MGNESDITIVERRLSSERKTRAYQIRASRAKLEQNMTNAMKDAEQEIEKAFRFVTEGHGYVCSDLDSVRGGGVADPEYMNMLSEKLGEWQRECESKWRGVVLDVVVFGFPTKDIAFQRDISVVTVLDWFRKGLNEYCLLRGWGEQIK